MSEAPAAGAATRQPPATPTVSPAAAAEAATSEAAAKAAWLAKQDLPATAPASAASESAAKAAWLAKQEAPAWGQGVASAAPVAAAASSPVASVSVAPAPMWAAAPVAAPLASSSDEAAKAAWMAKQELPARALGGSTASESAAKAAWLAKQEAPSWGHQVAAVAAECDEGDAEACDSLLSEDEARLAWLAKQGALAWGRGGAAAAPIAPADDEVIVRTMTASLLVDDAALLAAASTAAAWLSKRDVQAGGQGGAAPATSEEVAKAAWLAKQEVVSWGKDVMAGSVVAGAVAEAEQAIGSMGDMLDVLAGLPEEEAKRAWLDSQDQLSAAQASAWSEAAAKAAWLAKLDLPATAPASAASESAAKAAWLAKQEAPAWGQGRAAVVPPPPQASCQELSLQELCEEDVEEACDTISLEEEAKLAWLAKQTPPALRGFVVSPPPPVAATEAEVLAQGERLLQGTGLNLTAQETEAVRAAMEIIRRQ